MRIDSRDIEDIGKALAITLMLIGASIAFAAMVGAFAGHIPWR